MRKKASSIPQNNWSVRFAEGLVISRTTFEDSTEFEDVGESHRDTWHLFNLQEKGTTSIEIDFQKYEIQPSSVIYIHPNQVHRLLAFKQATVSTWAINNEKLKPEYLQLLEDITPVKPLSLDKETFTIIAETAALGMKYAERKEAMLYQSLLKDNCNLLVALVASQYLAETTVTGTFSRFDVIAKAFKTALEKDFKMVKSPAAYARKLNISAAYLNECVKNATGNAVSYHIQHRIVLEAERLLYHSDRSVQEVAFELGYDDYSYFTRLFSRITGMSPSAFRSKNRESS